MTNISIAVRDKDYNTTNSNVNQILNNNINNINNIPSVDELKNEMYGLNINSNKNFIKSKDIKKINEKDIISVIINQTSIKSRSIDY